MTLLLFLGFAQGLPFKVPASSCLPFPFLRLIRRRRGVGEGMQDRMADLGRRRGRDGRS